MGWTHNWRRTTELSQADFARAVEDIRKVLEATGVALGGFDGTGNPLLSEDTIVFNGAKGASCEPFEIHQTEFDRRGRNTFLTFCKTEHAPYDICVQVTLIALKHYLGDNITVASDGTDEDWEKARNLCQQQLGYGAGFHLSKETG